MTEVASTPRAGRRAGTVALRVAALIGVVALVFWVNESVASNLEVTDAVRRFGYPGLFVIAAISGFNLLVPIPIIAFFPFLMDAGLAPVPAVAVIAAGMTVGDMVGYLLGRLGRKLVEKPHWMRRMERVQERHRLAPYVLLFFWASFAPLPNEVIVIPMALIGCRWLGVLLAALGGNIIFNSLAAAGFEGLFGFL